LSSTPASTSLKPKLGVAARAWREAAASASGPIVALIAVTASAFLSRSRRS
jgi:hypothetical protein